MIKRIYIVAIFAIIFEIIAALMFWPFPTFYLASAFILLGLIGIIYESNSIFSLIKKQRLCFSFISNMVVAINVKKTIEDAFIFYLERENNHSLIKSLVHGLSALEAISALSEYFSYPIYQNFQDIITIYINEGGDILTLTTYLLDDIHRANSHLQKVIKLSLRKSIEVLILWILCFLAAIMMRFSIKDIYEAIISNYYISLGLVTLYGLLIMTFYFGCRLFKSEITIKEQV
ncbi:MAG: hypothetical protein LKF69_05445 [Bacilli bacterium]|jgi:hypothetical protein|nr:hypothetical protein [Bacilli bacterium]MCH4236217.1 hypothetical protein [Bacilli bacterium]